MKVRAKFWVSEIKRHMGGTSKDGKYVPCEVQTIVLNAVTSGSEENKSFFNATPSGRIELGMVNKEAADLFELQKEYYIEFTKAE